MSDDIYRIQFVRRRGSSSGSETKLYQGSEREKMLTDLLTWELETRSDWGNARDLGRRQVRLTERWLRWLTGKADVEERHEVQALEKHTDAGWVKVEYSFVQPAVVLDGEVFQ